MMKVFVVLGQDDGCGVPVEGVFATLEAAQQYVKENHGCYIYSKGGHDVEE